MDRQEVEKIMGRPTQVEENVMIYKYDYPHRQVLLRFVLDEDDFLIEKHLETADELARKTPEQFEEDMPQAEEETEEGDYPGGPLPRFRDWRNRRLRN
jgi:hypothetical protein